MLKSAYAACVNGQRAVCRETCLKLLEFPLLGNYTRIEALHILNYVIGSTEDAKKCLADAMELIDDVFQRQTARYGQPSAMPIQFKQDNIKLHKRLDRRAKRG